MEKSFQYESLSDLENQETTAIGAPLPKRIFVDENCQYGAPFIAARYCGFSERKHIPISGEWAHGWHPPDHNIHPELVVGTLGRSYAKRRRLNLWVARHDQAEYLKSVGYRNVVAIGLPIIYLPKIQVEREENSLLVMPVHSTETTKIRFSFKKYVEEIQELSHKYTRIVACISPYCLKKNYWVKEFGAAGIPVVSGAYWYDRNSLLRMATLFSRFDCVTSNGFGSHLVYSAFFGARPSIYGTIPRYSPADFASDRLLTHNCPDLLPLALKLYSEEYLRTHYSSLFCLPHEATTMEDWAKFQVGFSNKLVASSLSAIFMNPSQQILFNLRKHANKLLKRLIKTPH